MPGSSVNALAPQWRSLPMDWTGNICIGGRIYLPPAGRFLSPDPLGHDASMSLYSYCEGDGVNRIDPDGRCGTSAWANGADQYTLLNGYSNYAFNGTIDEQIAAQRAAEATNDALTSMFFSLPGLNVVRSGLEAISGRDLITGDRISASRDMAYEFATTLASTAATFLPLPGIGIGSGIAREAMVAREAGALRSGAGSFAPKGILFTSSELTGVERASQGLLDAVGSRRAITIATEGSDALRYLNYRNAEAAAFPASGDIILRTNPSKAAVLEEFLHGTQSKLGIIDRLGTGGAETHVKDFMIRHQKMLGLSAEDVVRLQKLKDMGL
jgi:RHS repeat-associated protein